MPNGGGYSVNRAAKRNLVRSVQLAKDQTLVLAPDLARPSFCSGATYLALLGALAEMEKQGMPISREAKERLVLLEHPDGEGIWGRWNANGPGTARLFQELRLGTNFTELEKAQPGDFLKLWWTDGIGAKERGHSVIFLGTGRADDGTATIRFWSSNVPDGFGEKTVSLSKVKHMVFSRLEHPERFNAISKLPMKDAYLASMLEVDESFSGMTKKLGLPGTR